MSAQRWERNSELEQMWSACMVAWCCSRVCKSDSSRTLSMLYSSASASRMSSNAFANSSFRACMSSWNVVSMASRSFMSAAISDLLLEMEVRSIQCSYLWWNTTRLDKKKKSKHQSMVQQQFSSTHVLQTQLVKIVSRSYLVFAPDSRSRRCWRWDPLFIDRTNDFNENKNLLRI